MVDIYFAEFNFAKLRKFLTKYLSYKSSRLLLFAIFVSAKLTVRYIF